LLKQLNYLSCKLKSQIHDPTASHQYTSILINLFIKVELNILLVPPVLSTIFVPKTSGHTFGWFYGGARKTNFCPTTWRNKARRSKMVFRSICKQGPLRGFKNGKGRYKEF